MRIAATARAAALAGSALLTLVGCASTQDAAQPSTSGDPQSSASATPEPSSPAPSEPAQSSPAPSQPSPSDATATPPQCADAFVVANLNGPATVTVEGSDQEVLAYAQPRPGFAEPDALLGLDVLCAVTHHSPVDGTPGTATVSYALVDGSAAVEPSLEGWAAGADYTDAYGSAAGGPYFERFRPMRPDGTTTMKVIWYPLSWDALAPGTLQETIATTDLPLDGDDILVVHSDFTSL